MLLEATKCFYNEIIAHTFWNSMSFKLYLKLEMCYVGTNAQCYHINGFVLRGYGRSRKIREARLSHGYGV